MKVLGIGEFTFPTCPTCPVTFAVLMSQALLLDKGLPTPYHRDVASCTVLFVQGDLRLCRLVCGILPKLLVVTISITHLPFASTHRIVLA